MKKIKKIVEFFYVKLISQKSYIKYLRKKGIQIGNECDIYKTTIFGAEPYLIKIGNKVRISHNVKFITHDGGLWVLRNLDICSKNADKMGTIQIGDNVNIGWDVMIMPDVKIGNNVVVGAGAIVTKSIPDNVVVAGVPAKVIENIDEYYKKNKDKIMEIKNLDIREKKKYLQKKYKLI